MHSEAAPVLYDQITIVRTFPFKNGLLDLMAYVRRENTVRIRCIVFVEPQKSLLRISGTGYKRELAWDASDSV